MTLPYEAPTDRIGGVSQVAGIPDAPALSQATPPTSADGVNVIGNLSIPLRTPSSGNITNAVANAAGHKTAVDLAIQEQEDLQSLETARNSSPQETQAQTFFQKYLSSKSPAEARSDATTQTGINPTQYFADQQARLAEVDKLTEDYNKAVASRDASIAKVQDNAEGTYGGFIDSEVARINKNAAPVLNQLSSNINAKVGLINALKGNFQEAQQFIDQAVQDATADSKFSYDSYVALHSANEDTFNRIDSQYKDAFDTAMGIAKTEWQDDVDTKNKIGELMIKYPHAGINLNDSLTSAFGKAATNAGTSGSGTESNFTDIMQAAIDAGATPEQAAREAATVSENAGIQVDLKTLNLWTSQARQLKKTAQPEGASQTIAGPSGTGSPIFSGVSKSTPAYYSSATTTDKTVKSLSSYLFR